MLAAQGGDLAAFNRLVLEYQALAYNVAYRMLGDPEAAADATQDSFLKAYRKLSQYRGGTLQAWLLRIVTNTCLDARRAAHRHPWASLPEPDAADRDRRWRASEESPEEHVLRMELGERLKQALDRLPDEQRVVVVLHDVEGCTCEEVAEIAGVELGTAKSRLSRARARLRDLLVAEHGLSGSREATKRGGQRLAGYGLPVDWMQAAPRGSQSAWKA